MGDKCILLLEDRDPEAEAMLAALAQDGPRCRVRRVRSRESFHAALGEAPLDVVVAAGAVPGLGARTALDAARARCPSVPVVLVALDARTQEALVARGAAACVGPEAIPRLGAIVTRAIADHAITEDRRRAEAALRFLVDASEALSRSFVYEETLAAVARLAVPRVADLCWITVRTGGAPLVVIEADPRLAEAARAIERRAPADDPFLLDSRALAAGRPELIDPLDEDALAARARDPEHLALLRALGGASLVAAPIGAVGAIALVSRDPERRHGPAHLACAVDLARRAAASIEQARLYRDALAAGRRKDELFARVAHELRTPLNALLGWASMLRTRRLDEAARARALETIERNARAEARMIEELLDASRMLTGSLRLDVMELDPCPLVANELEALRPIADAKGVLLGAELDDTAGTLAGDPARVRQIVREIVEHCVRATPREGRVDVRLGRAGDAIEIVVRDGGKALRSDPFPTLVDALCRAGANGSAGLGLGLAIARHLAEAHGGGASAASDAEGRGAVFTVRLPRTPRSSEAPSR